MFEKNTHKIWDQFDISLNNSYICKITNCKHEYSYSVNENALKNHYMKKHYDVWVSIRSNRRGRRKKNQKIEKERERIFSVAEDLNDELITSFRQEDPSLQYICNSPNDKDNDVN